MSAVLLWLKIFGSIIKVGVEKEPTNKKQKKVEHILPKSVKIELLKNLKRRKNMLYRYFREKLLGLQDILIENIEEIDGTIHIYCKLERKMHKCPACGNHTDKIHDYR